MAQNITIQVDQTDIELLKGDLRHINNGMPTAVMRSINRAADGVKTDMVAIATRVYTVKATAARKNINVTKATSGNLNAGALSKGKPIPLVDFNIKPSTVQPNRKLPITAEVIKGQPKPILHAFVAVMPTGHKGVFWRKKIGGGPQRVGRLPIEELSGPRIEDLYARAEFQAEIQAGADNRLTNELDRQADFIFQQRNGLL